MTGGTGAATEATERLPGALCVLAALTSAQVMVIVPTAPAVYVMAFVPPTVTPAAPPGLVMPPPLIVQWYVMPACAVTDATFPVDVAVTMVAPVSVGVLGNATTMTVAVPVVLTPPRETTQVSVVVPTEPTENVIAKVPAPDVMVPLVMDHA